MIFTDDSRSSPFDLFTLTDEIKRPCQSSQRTTPVTEAARPHGPSPHQIVRHHAFRLEELDSLTQLGRRAEEELDPQVVSEVCPRPSRGGAQRGDAAAHYADEQWQQQAPPSHPPTDSYRETATGVECLWSPAMDARQGAVPISERERGERRQGTARPCPGSLKNAKGGANIGGEYCEAREKSSVGGGNFESANLKLAVPHAEESTSLREMYGEEEVLDYPMDGAPPLDLRGGFGPPSRPRRKKKKPPSGNGNGNNGGRRGKSKKRESSGERRGKGPRRKHRSRSRSGDAHQQQQHQAREAGPHQPAHW
ncbi:hypothetical protein THAOC_21846, partial [Thalassiosira oceanica]